MLVRYVKDRYTYKKIYIILGITSVLVKTNRYNSILVKMYKIDQEVNN